MSHREGELGTALWCSSEFKTTHQLWVLLGELLTQLFDLSIATSLSPLRLLGMKLEAGCGN
ncbi:MAG: hypothetical protein ACOVS5_09590, partial [Oligoflexus sp.]